MSAAQVRRCANAIYLEEFHSGATEPPDPQCVPVAATVTARKRAPLKVRTAVVGK